MLRAIQEIKPRFVIAENVFGITNIDGGLVFEQVCLDLETEGYEVQPFIIPAAAKNAPHRRDRCWFLAYSHSNDGRSTNRESGCKESKSNTKGEQSFYSRIWATSNEGYATNSNGNGFNECNGNDEVNTSEGGEYAQCNINTGNVDGDVTYALYKGLQGRPEINGRGKYNSKRGEVRNIIRTTCKNNGRGYRSNFENFPTQSPICGGDDGLPTELDGITFPKWRAESIKGYGNAIVPQVAYELFKALEKL
jgi:DNA (cytosine-5)-methyltransferase 1